MILANSGPWRNCCATPTCEAIAREHNAVERERVDLALGAAGLAAYEWDIVSDRLLLSERLAALVGFEGDSASRPAGAADDGGRSYTPTTGSGQAPRRSSRPSAEHFRSLISTNTG